MKPKYIVFIIAVILFIYTTFPPACAEPVGTAYSRPNVSGGFDFYDPEGNKIGFSSGSRGGGYDYYDQYGNKTGSIKFDQESSRYIYHDAENIRRGKLTAHPYGGYRYTKEKEDQVTATQMRIRRDYKYANPYGSGIETFPPDVIRGLDSKSTDTEKTGLESSPTTKRSGLETSASE